MKPFGAFIKRLKLTQPFMLSVKYLIGLYVNDINNKMLKLGNKAFN